MFGDPPVDTGLGGAWQGRGCFEDVRAQSWTPLSDGGHCSSPCFLEWGGRFQAGAEWVRMLSLEQIQVGGLGDPQPPSL